MITTREYGPRHEGISAQQVAIDFDRTLGDVDASMSRLYTSAEVCGVQIGDIIKAHSKRARWGIIRSVYLCAASTYS